MLYLHIPFCQSRCIYCDFYSTTASAAWRPCFVEALVSELYRRSNYLPAAEAGSTTRRPLRSVYFGGGTPSQLTDAEVERIFSAIRDVFEIRPQAEVTFEANPDDITPQRVAALRQLGVNRVSLGVQSFSDPLLRLLRRRHSADGARRAVEMLVEGGIENVSIDLIYGLPQQSLEDFKRDCREALSLPVSHLSSYALSVEPDTPLGRMVAAGTLQPADEDLTLAQYEALLEATEKAGFDHYEISNFCRPGCEARHNSGYWQGIPYLGLGPGAHSFSGTSRRFNLPDLRAYIEATDDVPHEMETLSLTERVNEFTFTALRTRRGLDLGQLREKFGAELAETVRREARRSLANGLLEAQGETLRLTRRGLFVSNDVMSDLML